jgi:hypothetical protein
MDVMVKKGNDGMISISYLEPANSASPRHWDWAAIGRAFRSADVHVARAHTTRLGWWLARAVKRVGIGRNIFRHAGKAYVVPLTWASDSSLFPKGLFCEAVPFVYDCWPPQYGAWVKLFRRYRIRLAFVSSKASASYLSEKLADMRCYWMPEAADVETYDPRRALRDRQIDVLQYGRSYAAFHEAVRSCLDRRQRNYVYSGGRVIFGGYQDLCDGLANSKLVMCYPKSMTDPVDSGGLETVTLRYFEAMASGALPIGYCPAELEELFGYNPVLEFDLGRAGEQIEDILSNIENYQGLADRNLQRVREVGSWHGRVRQMLAILGKHGYAIPVITALAAGRQH